MLVRMIKYLMIWSIVNSKLYAPNGIRIRVSGLKGRRPSPLDDGGLEARARLRVSGRYLHGGDESYRAGTTSDLF